MQNNKTIQSLSIVFIFFFSLFLYTKIAGPISFSINNLNTNKNDVFSVSGEGKTIVIPDIAYVNVGIQGNGATVKIAQDQINKVNNDIVVGLKKIGIDEKDIKTSNYNINPNYDWTSSRQRITGYMASTNLSIKVRNIEKINDVIDSATANGANSVGGITFDVENKTKAEEKAREEAVANAKAKAEQAAKIAGFKLGKIINYSESSNSPVRPLYGLGGQEMLKSSAPATDIQTGSTEITITVNLSYQLD